MQSTPPTCTGSAGSTRVFELQTLAGLPSLGQASIMGACSGREMNNRRKLLVSLDAGALTSAALDEQA